VFSHRLGISQLPGSQIPTKTSMQHNHKSKSKRRTCSSTRRPSLNDPRFPCSGNIKDEPGAVVCRVSPSLVRFGTFQLPAWRGGMQTELVPLLADFVIKHHYPHLQGPCF